jgi:hypothetical protein
MASMPADRPFRWAGPASVLYGAGLLFVVVVIGVVVAGAVPVPAELLADVTRRRSLWVVSQAVLAIQQVLLVPVVVGLAVVLGPAQRQVSMVAAGLFGLAAMSFVCSGVIHGVLGVHLVHQGREVDAPMEVVLAEVELVHAMGDTFWFAGIAGLALATAVLAAPIRRSGRLPAGLATLGLVAVAFDALQLLWFFVPALGVAGALGAVLHSAWFAWLGRSQPFLNRSHRRWSHALERGDR